MAHRSSSVWACRGRHPPVITTMAIAALLATAVRLGTVSHQLALIVAYSSGFSGRTLLAGRYATVVSSLLLCRSGLLLGATTLLLAGTLGVYEVLAGTARAGLVAIAGGVASRVVVALVLAGGSALGVDRAAQALSTPHYGAWPVIAAAGGALTANLVPSWMRVALAAIVVGGVVVRHQLLDAEHVASFLIGLSIGYACLRRAQADREFRPSAPHPPSQLWRRAAGISGTALGGLAGMSGAALLVSAPSSAPGVGAQPSAPAASAPSASSASSPLRVVETQYPTPSLGGSRRVLVVLPAGYDNTEARLPVLEVLHGSPGRPEDLFSYDLTGVMAKGPPFIAVVPDGHGPVVAEGDFADTSRQKLGAALSDDLRHWVDTTYRSNGQWGVTGYSSGGYGASYLASRPAGGYARVCTMSGYFTAEDPAFKGEPRPVRDAASPLLHVAPTGPPTMLIVGNDDKEGLTGARTYVAAMNRVGQANDLVILPGAHDGTVWQPGLPRCVSFLLRTAPPPG